jgi:hypothetical protein
VNNILLLVSGDKSLGQKNLSQIDQTYSIVILISDYVFKIDLSFESINEISCYTETYESISVHNYEQVVGVA